MIVRVLENLSYPEARYLLIARKEHMNKEKDLVKSIERDFNVVFIPIENLTEGTACTVLYARKYINNNEPLLIANSDQIVDINIEDFVIDCIKRDLDGSILTFIDKYKDPKWSFAKIDDRGMLIEVKEKVVISKKLLKSLIEKENFLSNIVTLNVDGKPQKFPKAASLVWLKIPYMLKP